MQDKKIRVPVSIEQENKLKKARLFYIQINGITSEDMPLRKFYNIIMQYGINKFEDKYNRILKP